MILQSPLTLKEDPLSTQKFTARLLPNPTDSVGCLSFGFERKMESPTQRLVVKLFIVVD